MARVSPAVPALVTGASSGIGEQFARQLAARGHDLVVVARRAARLEALATELEAAHGVTVTPLVADLETEVGIAAVQRRLESGGPWLLVSNAGFGTRGPVAELDVEREAAEVTVNTVAMHRLCCVATRVNVAHGAGGIIAVASMAGFQPIPYFATYAATKAFMLHFIEALAAELHGSGVTVMALCPGPVRTEFIGNTFEKDERFFKMLFIDSDKCVEQALRAFDRGHVICVPGRLMRAGTVAVPLVPRGVLRTVAGRFQEFTGLARPREEAANGAPRRRAATAGATPRPRRKTSPKS